MHCRSIFSPAFLLGITILLALDPRQQAKAFEVRPMAFSNTTKNRLMMPLNIDNKLLSSSLSMSKPDNEPAAPRGIVLNTAVGGLTFAGGLMGFVTRGSKASLIAGSTFGGLLMLSSFIISKTKSAKGNILGFFVSGMLGYVMGKKVFGVQKVHAGGPADGS